MNMVRIIAVGKRHDSDIAKAIETYQQRLKRPFDVEWIILPGSNKNGDKARQDESEHILARLNPDEKVILLDERGGQLTSEQFSGALTDYGSTTIIIGGAFGVDDKLRGRADLVLSLSKMVFPHQLVRLILIEQIYRAQSIAHHHPYHHV